MAQDGYEMKQLLRRVLHEPSFAGELASNGLATIKQKHTCAHRVDELLKIYAQLAKETRPQMNADKRRSALVRENPRLRKSA